MTIKITPSTEPAPPLPIWQGALFPGMPHFEAQEQRELPGVGPEAYSGKIVAPEAIGSNSTPLFAQEEPS